MKEMKEQIKKVSEATGQSETDVIAKLLLEDHWTWFLIGQASA